MIPTNNTDDNQPKEVDWFIVKLILVSAAVGIVAAILIIVL